MIINIRGTYSELSRLPFWDDTKLCELIRVDPYRLCMVDTDREIFVITNADLQRVGMLSQDAW